MKPRGIRASDRLLIAGPTGKGKTTFAHYVARGMQPIRLIVFDPKAELSFPGVTPVRSTLELAASMHLPIVHYIPSGFDRDLLEEACQIVWETPGPWLWWVDEGSEMSSPGYCPRGLRLGETQGREPKKMVMCLTQRLSEIHPVFRSQSSHVVIFVPRPVDLDLKAIAGNINRDWVLLGDELDSLQAEHGDFSHLWYVRDTDELRRCAPLPAGVSTHLHLPNPRPAAVGSPPCEDSDSA